MASSPAESDDALLAMHSMPGHLIRRAKQKTNQAFAPITQQFNLTPIQYSVLKAIAAHPGADQATLGERIGLDSSTVGEVIARLVGRGLVVRTPAGRRQLVQASQAALEMLDELQPMLQRAQEEITSGLTLIEKRQFMRLLSKMVGVHNLHYQPRKPNRGVPSRARQVRETPSLK